MSPLTIHVFKEAMSYDGSQLAPRWLYQQTQTPGECLLGIFVGPCFVPTENMVDIDDRKQGAHIRAQKMVHFIAEFSEWPLSKAVLAQNLMICWIAELLRGRASREVTRSGNDLFIDNRKLSVSIAATSGGSSLVHIGINIDPTGAPVAAIGLAELGYSTERFVMDARETFSTEWTRLLRACSKSLPLLR